MIRLSSIVKRYGPIGQPALNGVDLEIRRGEFIAITGPSGCGKSSLLHILGCLDRPTSGSYEFDGQETASLSDDALSRMRLARFGFVFQAFFLLPRLSALDNVCLPLVYAGLPRAERIERARKILERVGLQGKTHRPPTQLSGGESQRVAIARALANRPALLLADEPTGNLDSRTGREVFELFRELHADGMTVIVVTHDPNIAAQAERRLRMQDGKIVDSVAS